MKRSIKALLPFFVFLAISFGSFGIKAEGQNAVSRQNDRSPSRCIINPSSSGISMISDVPGGVIVTFKGVIVTFQGVIVTLAGLMNGGSSSCSN